MFLVPAIMGIGCITHVTLSAIGAPLRSAGEQERQSEQQDEAAHEGHAT